MPRKRHGNVSLGPSYFYQISHPKINPTNPYHPTGSCFISFFLNKIGTCIHVSKRVFLGTITVHHPYNNGATGPRKKNGRAEENGAPTNGGKYTWMNGVTLQSSVLVKPMTLSRSGNLYHPRDL